ncbi:MAG: IS200/IS605 family transposase [Bacteroidales bacterium]|jgi:REP element-mobilizing transposase RayT
MKPGTFTQLYVHLVFAVKFRDKILTKTIRKDVFKYMSGILSNLKHKSIIINGVSDHVHILFGLNPSVSISDTVHSLKRSSSLYINNENLCKGKFAWQEGYGAFTCNRKQLENTYKYIENQESHHSIKPFKKEYIEFLEENDIQYDKQFLFDFFDQKA